MLLALCFFLAWLFLFPLWFWERITISPLHTYIYMYCILCISTHNGLHYNVGLIEESKWTFQTGYPISLSCFPCYLRLYPCCCCLLLRDKQISCRNALRHRHIDFFINNYVKANFLISFYKFHLKREILKDMETNKYWKCHVQLLSRMRLPILTELSFGTNLSHSRITKLKIVDGNDGPKTWTKERNWMDGWGFQKGKKLQIVSFSLGSD